MNCNYQTITYGRWPQGADGAAEPIQWRILSEQDDRILVMAEKILDMQPFNDTEEPVHWHHCSLRKWLEEVFMQQAFTTAEQARIFCNPKQNETDTIDIFLWQLAGADVSTSKQGSVFLLGIEDVARYFPDNDPMFCPGASADASEYVKKQYNDFADGSWWLRSSFSDRPANYIVSPADSFGMVFDITQRNGVRPAMWLKKE